MTDHIVPVAALSQHIAILGKTRSGKSSVMRGLVEGLLDRELPVCIIDPKGDWWGIKLAKDGKRPGYPVVIFGGEHADVPITAHAGAHVAELFATGNRPCLIDLGGWMVGERTRFYIDFASTLFRLTRGMRWLVIDEIHNFAPKGKVMDPDAGKALHWTNRLASEGLGKGLPMLFASQRPQKVHNDTLTSAETLIAMRVLHPSDRGAVSDWIKGCGDIELGNKVLNSLAQMDRGEGWLWSPEIGLGPKRVKFPMFKTYDSFRPQSAEDTASLKGWATVDLDDVKTKLATVVKEAEANDPKTLRAEIARLNADLRKSQKGPLRKRVDPKETQRVLRTHIDMATREATDKAKRSHDKQIALLRELLEEAMKFIINVQASKFDGTIDKDELEKAIRAAVEKGASMVQGHVAVRANEMVELRRTAGRIVARLQKIVETQDTPVVVDVAVTKNEPYRVNIDKLPPKVRRGLIDGSLPVSSGDLKPGQRKIVNAMAELHALGVEQPSRTQLGMFAGYNLTGGSGAQHIADLVTAGYVEMPGAGSITLTEAGHTVADPTDTPRSLEELHQRVFAKLSSGQQKILTHLIQIHPASISRADLGTETEYNLTGGSGAQHIADLVNVGAVKMPKAGLVVASDLLFPEGLR